MVKTTNSASQNIGVAPNAMQPPRSVASPSKPSNDENFVTSDKSLAWYKTNITQDHTITNPSNQDDTFYLTVGITIEKGTVPLYKGTILIDGKESSISDATSVKSTVIHLPSKQNKSITLSVPIGKRPLIIGEDSSYILTLNQRSINGQMIDPLSFRYIHKPLISKYLFNRALLIVSVLTIIMIVLLVACIRSKNDQIQNLESQNQGLIAKVNGLEMILPRFRGHSISKPPPSVALPFLPLVAANTAVQTSPD